MYMKMDIKVHEKVVDLEKGFQEIELDSYYSNKTIKSVFKNNKNSDLIKTESGKYYFNKGDYSLKIGNYSESFQIK